MDMLGLHQEERGAAIALLVRSMHSQGSSAAERAASMRRHLASLSGPGAPPADGAATPVTIAAPLTADHWRDLLQLDDKADLFPPLLENRSVLLVCAGALGTDPSIRALLERDRGLLRWIVRTAPSAFWTVARSLRQQKDRIVVPGGPTAEPIWEALAGVKVTRSADFLRALLSRDGGRLAWFYDSVSNLPADRLRLVYGDGALAKQIDQTRSLYAAFRSSDSNWRMEEHPFLRGATDPWIVSSRIDVTGDGVAPPADQWFWEALFRRSDIPRQALASIDRSPTTPATLAWLVQRVASANARERRERFEMVRFAQGVFAGARGDKMTDALIALGGYRRYSSLLLTLDRMGIATPHVYARAVDAARRVDDLSGRDRRQALIAMQSMLAIMERARVRRAIDASTAERLVLALADTVETAERPMAAIVHWMITSLTEALPPLVQPDQFTGDTAYESRLLQALAGRPAPPDAPRVTWEGLDYTVDYFAADHERIKRIRAQLPSPGLDAAIARNDPAQIVEALLVLVYTPALGDPDGPALLGGDVPTRHTFGLEGAAGLRRNSLAWSVPREQVGDGAPWHLEGSLLGLDLALARLALRRLSDDDMPVAPTINLNDQLTLSRTMVAMNPDDLRDADRDLIVEAVARGRRRVADAGTNLSQLRALADEAGLTAAVKQTLPWTLTRTPDLVSALFALRDFMWLGRPELDPSALDLWGVYSDALDSRLRTRMPAPSPWDNLGGRADGGLIATQVPDLTLRMAEETARHRLPAQLVPALLVYATQDFWHDVESRFPDDWPAMARQALALSPSRVEDYVAGLTGSGPLRPR